WVTYPRMQGKFWEVTAFQFQNQNGRILIVFPIPIMQVEDDDTMAVALAFEDVAGIFHFSKFEGIKAGPFIGELKIFFRAEAESEPLREQRKFRRTGAQLGCFISFVLAALPYHVKEERNENNREDRLQDMNDVEKA